VPVVAVLLGWAILGEDLSMQTLVSTCVIIMGVALMINYSSRIKIKAH
jgi:drug/metabolite transporter (DMT)-like permease